MDTVRERRIYAVTLKGSLVNVVLLIIKFAAGIIGASAAMIADAVHSLSDFVTDVVVIVLVKLSNKPQDENHDYGHGKYETLATAIIGLILFVVGVMIAYRGITSIIAVWNGQELASPGVIALIAALVSIVLKEWAYRFTKKVGQEVRSEAVIANAWHHRSDAFSSIGTALGIGGAVILGHTWTVLDPIAAVIVSLFIIRTAYSLLDRAMGDLLERSLPKDIEDKITAIAASEEGVQEVHHLRTRCLGSHYAIEMHVRMAGETSLYEAHLHATEIENRLRRQFGEQTHVSVHVEPIKINGKYEKPRV